MKRTLSTALAIVSIVMFAGIVGTSAADDGKNYHGSHCKAYYGTEAADFVHDVTGIRNVSGQTRAIFCPILVDAVEDTDGLASVNLRQTGIGVIYCSLESRAEDGTWLQGYEAYSGPGSFTIQRLGFDHVNGSYSLWCALPAGGTLNTIRIVEQD